MRRSRRTCASTSCQRGCLGPTTAISCEPSTFGGSPGADGRPLHTQVGVLPPGDLLPELDYGRALHAMTTRDYAGANALFGALSEQTDAERAPEACYWWGISRMRETKDPTSSLEPWGLIRERWPGSQWARKVAYALDA